MEYWSVYFSNIDSDSLWTVKSVDTDSQYSDNLFTVTNSSQKIKNWSCCYCHRQFALFVTRNKKKYIVYQSLYLFRFSSIDFVGQDFLRISFIISGSITNQPNINWQNQIKCEYFSFFTFVGHNLQRELVACYQRPISK